MREIIALLLLLVNYTSFGQNVDFEKSNFKGNKNYGKAYNSFLDGRDYYDQGVYNIALNYFLPAHKFNPDNAELNFMIGDCYLHSIYKDKALEYLKKSWELDPEFSKEIYFLIAEAYQFNYKFREAKKEYYEFKISLSPNALYEWTDKIKKKMTECNNGIVLMANPTGGMVVNLKKINSEASEYGPIITADGKTMYFTSRREGSTGGKEDLNDFQPFEDIYVTHKEGYQWQEPENIGPPINTATHDATVGISPDGQELYIYRGNVNGGDIFTSTLYGSDWSEPVALPAPINSPAHENSASLSYDNKTLYFVSDREGGYGGRDIYVVSRDEHGIWGEVKNIGNRINTKYDEDGVFIHPDGKTLYFSSKGHNTMGGYDIFYSVKDKNGNWTEPKNMGFPINSPDDDVFFVVTADGQQGYYSSVRKNGTGGKDIFVINFSTGIEDKSDKELTLVQGKITDNQDNPVQADIEIYDVDADKSIGNYHSNEKTGEYLISLPAGKNYAMFVNKDDYLFYTENFNTTKKFDFEKVTKNIKLQPLQVDAKTILKNIYFDYAKAILKEESFSTLNRVVKFMNDNPNIKMEISGHTDNVSSLATNQPLSENRAKAVMNYLIKNGIDASRLTSKGYADKFPVTDNNTEEGKAQNRRVELKIIEK